MNYFFIVACVFKMACSSSIEYNIPLAVNGAYLGEICEWKNPQSAGWTMKRTNLTIVDNHPYVNLPPDVTEVLELPFEIYDQYRSDKSFIQLSGYAITNSYGWQLGDIEHWTLQDAKLYCQQEPKCSGFSYDLYFQPLERLNNITFFESIDAIYSGVETASMWFSFISNEPENLHLVNESHKISLHDDTESLDEEAWEYAIGCRSDGHFPSIDELQAVDTLERIPCTISRDEFQRKYEVFRIPVILTGCDDTWDAREMWKPANLIPRFANDTLWTATTWRNHSEEMSWEQIVEAMETDSQFYIFEQLLERDERNLRQDYETPGPFQDSDLYAYLNNYPPDFGFMAWFCMGSPYTGSTPHMDPWATDAWNSLLSGHKWWVIYPPEVDDEDMVSCSYEHPELEENTFDWFKNVGSRAAHMDYDSSRSIHVLQKPGETLYVPFGHVHSVLNMDHTVAVTQNYASFGNLEEVFERMIEEHSGHWFALYENVFDEAQREWVRENLYAN